MRERIHVLTAWRNHVFRFVWAFDTLAEARKKGMQYVQGAGRRVEISLTNRVIWARGVTKK